MTSVRVALFAAGHKGWNLLSDLVQTAGIEIVQVVSYRQPGALDDAAARIEALCQVRGIPVRIDRMTSPAEILRAELILVAGWQFMLAPDPRIVVFHDGLLPRYRGFAPTVAALIQGDDYIGVTALRPVEAVDAGPILAQHSQAVTYPIKIAEAFELLAVSYLECAKQVIHDFAAGEFEGVAQNETEATYSIWRDDDDYFINWFQDAARVCRTIDALGWPYQGARTIYNSSVITILEAHRGPDIAFEIREPGKVWSLNDGHPTVVCGQGTITITEARSGSGDLIRFERLRTRLG